MVDERNLVTGLQDLGGALERLVHVAVLLQRSFRRLLGELRGLRNEARGGTLCGLAFVPLDLQLAERAVRLVPLVGNDGDAIRQAVVEAGIERGHVALHDIDTTHARQRLHLIEVRTHELAVEHGALLVHRVLHAWHGHVDAEDRLALHDARAVDTTDWLADDLEVLGVLQLHGGGVRRRNLRGQAGELPIRGLLVLAFVGDHAVGRLALLDRHVPAAGRGGDEHQAGGRAHPAQQVVVHRNRQRTAGELAAVLHRIDFGVFDANVLPGDIQLFGNDHREGCLDALADLGVLVDDERLAVRRDTDVRVERRRRSRPAAITVGERGNAEIEHEAAANGDACREERAAGNARCAIEICG